MGLSDIKKRKQASIFTQVQSVGIEYSPFNHFLRNSELMSKSRNSLHLLTEALLSASWNETLSFGSLESFGLNSKIHQSCKYQESFA